MSAVAVHHVVTGRRDAPVLVLSNSLGASHAMWDAQVEALTDHFRVVRYDMRGHGASPVPMGPYDIDDLADDVVTLLDTLGVERAHLVGLSLGAMASMRVAARNPGRVERLVVVSTSARLAPASAWHERAAAVRARGTVAVAQTVVERWFTAPYLAAHPEVREQWVASIADTPAEGYASCCQAVAAMDLRDDLARITAPTLAIAGTDDPATPPEHLRAIAENVQDGRLVVVPSAAHLANVEQPELVTAAIIEHLAATS